MCYKTEILRLGPQNDIATQPLDRGMQKELKHWIPVFARMTTFYRNRTLYTDTIYGNEHNSIAI